VTLRSGYCQGPQTAPVSRWTLRLIEPGGGALLGPFGDVAPDPTDRDCRELLATFTVPQVRAGHYAVAICDASCTRLLASGSLEIAATPQLARLTALNGWLRSRLRGLSLRTDGRADRIDALEAELASVETALATERDRAERATSQRDVALDGREAAEAEANQTDRESRNWRVAAYLLALAMAITWTVAAVRRRGVVRIRIPDTIEELEGSDDRADH
jgi:hypothetical protein